MKRLFKTWLGFASLVGALLCLPQTVTAAEDEPIIEFKTVVAEASGGTSVTIFVGGFNKEEDYLDIDCGAGLEEQEMGIASFDKTTETWSGGMTYTCTPGSDGVVKIYGDPSNIAVINFEGCYISQIKMANMPNLYYLNLDHNQLEALDLSDQSSLQYITVADNPFDKSPLKIGGNKPNLQVLAIGQTDNLDQSFNLSDYPNIISFDAYACKGLKTVDPTGCPELQQLSLDGTQVSSLDVSKNTHLTILNISDTNIPSIDLSNLTYLQQFYADRQGSQTKLEKLDVTNNISLVYLFAAGNNFTEVDVTKNDFLQQLYLADNMLTSIDLSNNRNLVNVILRNNCFTYATLPEPQGTWVQYDYYQRNMPVAATYKVGDVIDLSDKVLREGTTTTFGMFLVDETNLTTTALDESYYKYENGKVTLLKEIGEDLKVYLAFANDMFPDLQLDYLPLRTDNFRVKTVEEFGKPDIAFSLSTPVLDRNGVDVKLKVGIVGATEANPKKFYVDFGDGQKKEFTATTETIPADFNVNTKSTYGTITVYVEQDDIVNALGIDGMTLNSIDLSKLRSMQYLSLVGTGLYAIDLGYNKGLKSLVLNGNYFSSLNIRGVNDYFQKNFLQDIDLSNNGMMSVTLNDMGTIHNLNLSNNFIEELSLKDADNMETLNLSTNSLTSVNLSYMTLMTKCDISNNKVVDLVMPETNSLKEFKCEQNALNFSTLPVLEGLDVFTFAPQKDVQIATLAPSIDLEDHSQGGTTVYVWKQEDGTALTEGTDYTITDGMTLFLSPIFGKKVYCEMSNPSFPGLTLKTSSVEAADMPKNKLATFKTLEDGEATMILRANDISTICIDWKGGGLSMATYSVDNNLTTLNVKTYAGRECAVYAYKADVPLYVFNITGAKLADVDLTNMTQLTLVNIDNAGISEIKLPSGHNLKELKLNNNNFESIDLGDNAADLMLLSMNDNKLTSFDATACRNLSLLYLANNQLAEVKLDNSNMWDLDLSGNQLATIDLSKVPSLNQVFLSNNLLETIDLSKISDLRAVHIDKNKFRFSTLPLPVYQEYQYGEQQPIDVTIENGVIDLSSEKEIDGAATTYRWFVGEPWYDEDSGELTGEELYIDDEYFLKDGITTFNLSSPIENVVGAMLNEKFPNLTVYTNPISVTAAGIQGVEIDNTNGPAKVYNINGMRLDNANGKGIFIIKQGNKTRKVVK